MLVIYSCERSNVTRYIPVNQVIGIGSKIRSSVNTVEEMDLTRSSVDGGSVGGSLMQSSKSTESRLSHNDNIAKYIKKIRTRLQRFIPENQIINTEFVASLLNAHLEDIVVDIVKEAVPFNLINESNLHIIDTLFEAAKLTFTKHEFLLHAKSTTDAAESVADVRKGIRRADSYILNLRQKKRVEGVKLEPRNSIAIEYDGEIHNQGAKGLLTFNLKNMNDSEKRMMLLAGRKGSAAEESQTSERKAHKRISDLNLTTYTNRELNSYKSVVRMAEIIVDDVISIAKDRAEWIYVREHGTSSSKLSQLSQEFVEVFGSFDAWPTVGEFTIELGADKIADYLATWYYEENWMYDLDMMIAQSDLCSDFYFYEVKWSIPTKEFPIPQATASVFFTIEVSRVIPPECPVNVTYKFEGCGYEHIPFRHVFQEKWLFNIIESKLKFFNTIDF